MTRTIGSILSSLFPKRKAELLEMDGAMPMDAEVPVAAEADADTQIKSAFRQAVVAAFDDDALDSKATLAKIKEILAAYDKLNGDEKKPEPEDKGGDTSESMKDAVATDRKLVESFERLANQIRTLNDRVSAIDRDREISGLLESLNIQALAIDAERMALLRKQATAEDMRKLIESWPSHVMKPRRVSMYGGAGETLHESVGDDKYPTDAKAFASAIRR